MDEGWFLRDLESLQVGDVGKNLFLSQNYVFTLSQVVFLNTNSSVSPTGT